MLLKTTKKRTGRNSKLGCGSVYLTNLSDYPCWPSSSDRDSTAFIQCLTSLLWDFSPLGYICTVYKTRGVWSFSPDIEAHVQCVLVGV